MAENEPITPEKQLLKLIENPNAQGVQAQKARREGGKWFSMGALKGRLGFLKTLSGERWTSLRKLFRTPPGIRQLNMALKFSILFLSLYLGYNMAAMGIQWRRASNLILQPGKGAPLETGQPVILKNLSYYTDKVASRDIFKLGATAKHEEESEGAGGAPKEDATKNFSLVGIAWSSNPEAMIENIQLKRTHFVKRGQSFDEDIKVVAIFKDRVVLSWQGKEFELK